MESAFPPGTVVAGRFRLDALIAEGGMGVVYRATELRERAGETREVRPVAIKLIHPRRAADEAYLARFERETDTVVRLQHPNIVPVIDFGEWDGRPYIAFAWIAGEDLGARIARVGRLSLDETLAVLGPVADALDAAHASGLVHRDIKPGNVLLGTREEVYLTDFGLARPSDALAAPTLPGARLMGTAPFIAPEQLRPKTIVPELAHRIDIYALACVAFACLTGDGPFRRDSDEAVIFAHADEEPPAITESRPDAPPALDGVLRKALAKNPADRHATARELVRAMRDAAAAPIPQEVERAPERPENTRPLPEVEPPPPPPPRRPSWLPIAAAAGGLVLVLVAVALASSRGGGPGPTALPTFGSAALPTTAREVSPTPVLETPTASVAPSGDLGAEEDQDTLLGLISGVAAECQPRFLSGREIAAVECESPGTDLTDFGLYETWTEIGQDWSDYLQNVDVTPVTGTAGCEAGTPGESGWYYTDPEVELGRLACHASSDGGWIVTWTDNRNNTWGWILRDDADHAAAWQAWKDAIIVP